MRLFFKLECSPGCTGGLISCKCEYLKDFSQKVIEGFSSVNTTDDPTEAIIIAHAKSQAFLNRFGFVSVSVTELVDLIKDINYVTMRESDFSVYVGPEEDNIKSNSSSRQSTQYDYNDNDTYDSIEEYYYYQYGIKFKEKGDATVHFSYF